MKRLLFVIMAFMAMTLRAENFSFLGIPINGSIATFQSKLLPKGFKLLETDNDGRWYSGNFFSQPVNVFVAYDKKIKIVYSVIGDISGFEGKQQSDILRQIALFII